MPLIGFREVFVDSEENEKRFPQSVRFSDRILKSVIVFGPLGCLHPIQNVFAGPDLPSVEESYSPFEAKSGSLRQITVTIPLRSEPSNC